MDLVSFYNRFPTEQACLDFLETNRWPNGAVCPHCRSAKTYKFSDGRLFRCGTCRKQFTVKVGTIFSESKIPLKKWFLIIYLATSLKKGISSVQVSKYVSVTQKSAWFMLHRIREALKESGGNMLGEVVEIDETYPGGVQKGVMGRAVKESNKQTVFGAVERGGRARIIHVPNSRGENLLPAILTNIRPGATIMSDQYTVYAPLQRLGYQHFVVNHSRHYAVGNVHTNSIEGLWAHLKCGIRAIQIHVSPKHLGRYCTEYEYRFNTRKMTDADRFDDWFGGVENRLTYRDLTV